MPDPTTQLESGEAPESAASDYTREADGAVSYTGDPKAFSQDMAAAVAQGLELGSMPPATGTDEVRAETATAKGRTGPALETGGLK